MTEEGLVHDLGALKRGEIYHKDDFLVRVRAWYKAEIGRLTHLDKVHEVSLYFQAWATVEANVNTLGMETRQRGQTTGRGEAARRDRDTGNKHRR